MTYPIVIVADRYGGTYSGGEWIAINDADEYYHGVPRAEFILFYGPSADNVTAYRFGRDLPEWAAVGATPNKALKNLQKKVLGG